MAIPRCNRTASIILFIGHLKKKKTPNAAWKIFKIDWYYHFNQHATKKAKVLEVEY